MQTDILDDFDPKIGLENEPQQKAKAQKQPFQARVHVSQGFFENFSNSEYQLTSMIKTIDLIPDSAKKGLEDQIPQMIQVAIDNGHKLARFLLINGKNFDYKNLQKYNTIDELLLDGSIGSYDKVIQIQEQKNRVYGTKDMNDELIIFKEFYKSFSDKIEGMQYIALNLNQRKLNQTINQREEENKSISPKYQFKSFYTQKKFQDFKLKPFNVQLYADKIFSNLNPDWMNQKWQHFSPNFGFNWLFKYPITQ